jgi:hypothetical protein
MNEEKAKRTVKQYDGALGRVQLLLKEVLQQLPEEAAKKMIDTINEGGEAALILRENSRGIGHKVAFRVWLKARKVRPKAFLVGKGGEA